MPRYPYECHMDQALDAVLNNSSTLCCRPLAWRQSARVVTWSRQGMRFELGHGEPFVLNNHPADICGPWEVLEQRRVIHRPRDTGTGALDF